MQFDPNDINPNDYTLDDARAELAREEQLRINTYSKWVEEKGKDPAPLMKQLGRLIKGRLTLDWLAKQDLDAIKWFLTNKERVKVAMMLLGIAHKQPDALVPVARIVKQFPGATIEDIREKMKEAA